MASSSSKASARAEKAAAERAAQAKREARRRILTIAGVVAAMVLIVGGAILVGKVQTDKEKDELEAGIPAAGADDLGLVIGDADAPHQVVIYEDFLCPICGQVEATSHEGLAAAAEEGKVLVEYRPIVILDRFGTYSERTASALKVVLDASGVEVAKTFHDLLFERQPEEGDDDAYFTDEELVAMAVEAGAEEADVEDGILDHAESDWAADVTQQAIDAGVTGTPTVLLDGEVFDDGGSWAEIGENLVKAVE